MQHYYLNPTIPELRMKDVYLSFSGTTGGFSMGGAMALHLACRYHPDVAGVFALSSFLNKDSVVYQVQYVSAKSSHLTYSGFMHLQISHKSPIEINSVR